MLDVEKSATAPTNDDNKFPADALSVPRQILFVGTICTAMFTNQCGMGNTIATVSVVGETFGISSEDSGHLSWLVAGYSLTIGTFILVGGRLGDEIGHKRLFVAGMLWYALWSLVAGLSVYASNDSGYVLFVCSRVFQGMGPALTLPNGLAILGRSYSPGPRKNMAFAWFGASAPFGAVAGFVFGGLFATLSWWPWTYWSQSIALVGVSGFAAWAIPPASQHEAERERQPWTVRKLVATFDVPGMVTGVTALVLVNFAWNQAVVVGWQQPYVYVCLILGFLFGAAFFYVELSTWNPAPILPLAAFNTDIAFVFACTATGWGSFGVWLFYVIQVAINIGGSTPLQIAAWIIPIIPVGLTSALAVGKLLGRVHASNIMLVGQIVYVIGTALGAARPPHSIYWTYFFFSVVAMTIGLDTSFPSATVIFSDAVPREYQGMGASIIVTVINYSISLCLGFAGTIETNINNGGHTNIDRLHGYRGALWFAVGLSGLGFVLSIAFTGVVYLRGQRKDTP
ncbi:multidrug-resistance type transporter aminotriazole resistance [Sporothrix stenoceras]|uniref:Multidrug-resistance type transporter aminotriazole resistance n=1 Tax=Sporothrix stenoceras TaxID=5173 RepID=A0ABR3YG46_9PEZI